MINDRQRVEMLLLPQMLWAVLECGVNDPLADDAVQCRAWLESASYEAMLGLDPRKVPNLYRRCHRLHLAVTEPYRADGTRVDKLGLMVLYMMQAILACDYLVLHEGSSLSKALDVMVKALAPAMEIEKLDASARKGARKILAALQAEGYFVGVGAANRKTVED